MIINLNYLTLLLDLLNLLVYYAYYKLNKSFNFNIN